jgi:membrane associated rhomboid family serine protease
MIGKRNYGLFGISAVPFRMVFLMWLVYVVSFQENIELTFLGVKPRTLESIPTILTAPLIHAGFFHLISNSVPILFLGTALFFFYSPVGKIVFWRCYLFPYILVWIFGPRVAWHLGASGLVYGLAFFLVIFGLVQSDFLSVILSLVVMILYGGIIFTGLFPGFPGVSWETHIAGGITGTWTAFELYFRERKKNKTWMHRR